MRDLLGERGGDDQNPVVVADDHVAGHHERAAAADRHVRLEWEVQSAEHRWMRRPVVGRNLQASDGGDVTQAAIGDDPAGAARERACGENVTDRPGVRLLARIDHQHLVGPDRFHGPLLGVQLAGVCVADVLAKRHVTQRVCVSEQPRVRTRRAHTGDHGVADPATGQLNRERCGRHRAQGRLRGVGENRRAVPVHAERGGASRGRDLRLGAEAGERLVGLHDPVGHRAHAVELDLDLVAGLDEACAGRRAGEDHVAGLEGHEA